MPTDLYGSSPFKQEPEEEGFLESLALAPIRGVAGAAAGVANLFGADVQDNFGLGHSSGVGGFVEGLTQFLTGFIPAVGVLGRAGALSKGAQATAKLAGQAGKARALELGRNVVAGAAADFAVFDGNDARLSNLLRDIPGLQNPITEFLASDENDSEVAGRLKNVIEGAGLGFAADGLVAIFRAMRGRNKAIAAGDTEAATAFDQEAEGIAEDLLLVPHNAVEVETATLLDPGPAKPRPEEDGLPRDLDETAPAADEEIETITPAMVEARTSYDLAEGKVILVNTQDTEGVMRGFSQFDSFVRERHSRLSIVQLKKDAKILDGNSKRARELAGKRPRGVPQHVYEREVMGVAQTAGFDAVTWRRGDFETETVVLNKGAVAQRITVAKDEPFWAIRESAQALGKDPELVARSPLESAVYNHLDLTPESAAKAVEVLEAASKGDKDALDKIPGLMNLTKMGERAERTLYKVLIDHFEWEKMVSSPEEWAQVANDAKYQTAKMLGMDPMDVAKVVQVTADSVLHAERVAVGTQYYMNLKARELYAIGQDLMNGKTITDHTGQALDRARALEMWGRGVEVLTGVASEFGRLRGAFGRGLNTLKMGVSKMSELTAVRSLEIRGGADFVLKQVQQYLSDMVDGTSVAVSSLMAKTRRSRIVSAATDWYMFSLLSAPRTLTTNLIGSAMTALWRPLESAVGAWVSKGFLKGPEAAAMQRASRVNMRRVAIARQAFLEATLLRSQMGPDTANAWAAARNSFRTGEPTLTREGSAFDISRQGREGINAEDIGAIVGKDLDPTQGVGRVVEMIGKITRTPGRFLGATDELIKQVTYHAHIKAELIEQAHERGLRDLDAELWVEAQMGKMAKNGQAVTEKLLRREAEQIYTRERFADNEVRLAHIQQHIAKGMSDDGVVGRSALRDEAVRVAREVTFTRELDPSRGMLAKAGTLLQDFVGAHPAMRVFFPFIRTPMNILMFATERMPVPGLNREFLPFLQYVASKKLGLPGLDGARNRFVQEITSGDPDRAAQAWGRATTATAAAAALGTAALSGIITGRGPSDPEQAKVLRQSGWQPYSLKVGDVYVSYQRLDPLATIMAFFGDWSDIARYSQDENISDDIALGWVMSVLTNLESKSYLAGLTDLVGLLHDPVKAFEKTAGRVAGSFAVPNVIAAARDFTDPHMPELNGILERVIARVPFMSNALDQQRNLLGEPMTKKTFGGGLAAAQGVLGYAAPLMINVTSSDDLTNEFTKLGYPFTAPRPQRLGVDLRTYLNDKGQSAYDRWQELTGEVSIGGRKLRPALERLVGSNRYQQMPYDGIASLDLDSPRISAINTVVNRYRRLAERKMLEEFPELKEHTRVQRVARSALQSGQPLDVARAVLFPGN